MAVKADLIARVRRRVSDARTPELYADVYYEDAVDRSLQRLNMDLASAYTVESLLAKYEYLLELRTTIEMALIRGGEGASSAVSDDGTAPAQAVTVPNLTVSRAIRAKRGPEHWLDLAARLEDEYERLFLQLEGTGEAVEQVVMGEITRQSLRTGGKSPYRLARPLTAVDIAVSLDGLTVSLTWTQNRQELFSHYSVERSATPGFTSYIVIARSPNCQSFGVDDEPGLGTWYYRVVVVSMDGLRSPSTTVTAAVGT